jgi:A/G-specific adenine glycosylase
MPWRLTRDPYRIWVSEVMLQQTQVATATPFYQTFLARFPTLRALACARPAEVLRAWAGLGYYRRARHLHEAARIVVRDHAGRIPDDPERFAELPGVGRYTTAAVMSIVHDRPLAVLDGNVARVLSRVEAMHVSVRDPRGARRLWDSAERRMPRRACGEWNQAMMELGAVVCTPRSPRCAECPIRRFCRAHALGRPEAFPAAPPRPATRRVRRAIAILERGGRWLMVRRRGPLLEGLWEPPGVDLANARVSRPALEAELAALGVRARLARRAGVVRHRITHRALEVDCWSGRCAGPIPRRSDLKWVDPHAPRVAVTALARRAARAFGVS